MSTPSPKQESAVRRLFRNGEPPRSVAGIEAASTLAEVNERVAATMDRLARASTEMSRLREAASSQHTLIYDQKEELAAVHCRMADAMALALRSEDLFKAEKARADGASARAAQLEAELATLRSHIGCLTAAIANSFEYDDAHSARQAAIPALREVA